MRTAVAALTALVLTAGALPLVRRAVDRPRLRRTNYRAAGIPRILGVVLVLPVSVAAAFEPAATPVWLAALAFGALGLADDLFGDRSAGGFRGHLHALVHGKVTTGMIKAAGGAAAGAGAALLAGDQGLWILADGALIAGSANLVNLLDLRPGRAAKAWLAAAGVVAWTLAPSRTIVAALAAGVGVWLWADLRELGMLGDVGANLLGAVLAATALRSHPGATARLGALALVVALTALSEVVAFSQIIDAVAPLRMVDRLGRRRPDAGRA